MKHVDTIVLVKNIEESKFFYSQIMQLEVLHDWTSMVVFKNRLAIHQIDFLEPSNIIGSFLNSSAIGSGNLIIYIGTEDLDLEYRRLTALNVEIVHGIVDLPWQRIFRIRDNCGYLIEVGEEEKSNI